MSSTLSPQLFAILSSLVEEHLGLHYGPDDRALFGDKITARAAAAGFDNPLDYYYFLRYDPAAAAELDALADALVVGETYFFRELDALCAAVEHVVAPAIAARGRARIWCAGCATGEEPLSLAMLLERSGLRGRSEIVATDVSARALQRAREADYGPRSLRALPPNPTPSGFDARLGAVVDASIVQHGGRVRVARSLVGAIDYRQLNLLDDSAVAALGTFDLVLCRNVLIYFADTTVTNVVGAIAKVLRQDGRLIVGASESLLRFGTALRCQERGGAFLYAKEKA